LDGRDKPGHDDLGLCTASSNTSNS